ncbi:DUF4158 domain-containing protein [Nocardia nova]|uniref:DUF4158 domain-containing protein n=1 Tax=Nocardia nova TaxID=37330 RepID=UPI0033E37794
MSVAPVTVIPIACVSRVELDRFFYPDDEDRKLIAARCRDYNGFGCALQLATVRFLGMFLTDPLDVPPSWSNTSPGS